MKIMINIGHPAHVHFFKYFIWNMEKRGHEILVSTTDKDVALKLLKAYGINYICVAKSHKKPIAKILDLAKADFAVLKSALRFKPDIFTGVGSITAAHVSRLMGKPSIIFEDTEHAKWGQRLYSPFASIIYTPSCYKKDMGEKQVRYNGYKELAYLHPNYFKPNPKILAELGLQTQDKFVILRFVAWAAVHDLGMTGLDMLDKLELIKKLEKHVRVFISSESPLPKEFEQYRIQLPPEKIHDLLYYASAYIGEGGTMATEAAILGTPSILISPMPQYFGNFEDLGKKYDLLYTCNNHEQALLKAIEFLERPNLKNEWRTKQQRMLTEKIDVTQFMIELFEKYNPNFKK